MTSGEMNSDLEDDCEPIDHEEETSLTPVKKRRRKWTNREKLKFIGMVEQLQETSGLSQIKACAQLNIPARALRDWKKKRATIEKRRPLAMSTAEGMKGQLHGVTDDLMAFVFELREMGVAVRNNMM